MRRNGLAYLLAKFNNALEESISALSPASRSPGAAFPDVVNAAIARFQEAFKAPLTTQMYIAGNAMSPTLNRKADLDKDAVEKLVVRLLPRPSARNVLVGDVVVLTPLFTAVTQEQHSHLVRRVAAAEGETMLNSADGNDAYVVPPDHCWVLADNDKIRPPLVADSRSFGHVPYSCIKGRVVYSAASRADHGPVQNNPESMQADDAVVAAEVDPEDLLDEGADEAQGGEGAVPPTSPPRAGTGVDSKSP